MKERKDESKRERKEKGKGEGKRGTKGEREGQREEGKKEGKEREIKKATNLNLNQPTRNRIKLLLTPVTFRLN